MADLPPVTFASVRVEQEFRQLTVRNPLLYRIVDEAAEYALATYGWVICIGDIWRSGQESAAIDAASMSAGGLGMGRKPGMPSPHCYWLAADFLTRGIPRPSVVGLDAWINGRWQYDPARPEMQVSDIRPHGTGAHLHAQAKPGVTIRRLPT